MGALKRWLRSAGQALWRLRPDWSDLHIYGGGLVVMWGANAIYPGTGWVVFGGLLVYIGLRRLRWVG